MRTRWITTGVTACFFAGSIFIASAQKADREDGADRYVNTEHKISFIRPAGWSEIVPEKERDGFVAFMGPFYGKHQANILVNVVVNNKVVPAEDRRKLLDVFLRGMIRVNQKEKGEGFKLLKTARIKIAGEDAVSMLFDSRHTKSGEWLKDRQVFVIHGDRLYSFNLAVKEAEFSQTVGKIEKMLNSIRWIEPQSNSEN